jgi:hypothetical protein
VLDPRNADVVYAAAYQRRRHTGLLIGGGPEGAIYKSTDGGATFKKLTVGLPTVDIGRIGLAISPQTPDVVYASITGARNGVRIFSVVGRRRNMGEAKHLEHERSAILRRVVCRSVSVRSRVRTRSDERLHHRRRQDVHADELVRARRQPSHRFRSNRLPASVVGNDGGLYESFDNGVTWRHFQISATQFYAITLDNTLPFYNIYGGTQDNGSIGTPSRSRTRTGFARVNS